jgi:hypothetical protein
MLRHAVAFGSAALFGRCAGGAAWHQCQKLALDMAARVSFLAGSEVRALDSDGYCLPRNSRSVWVWCCGTRADPPMQRNQETNTSMELPLLQTNATTAAAGSTAAAMKLQLGALEVDYLLLLGKYKGEGLH